jgi:Zn-dependent protease
MSESSFGFLLLRFFVLYIAFLLVVTLIDTLVATFARWRGDRSPQTASRATLHPLAHMAPIGTGLVPILCLMSQLPILIGWTKPFQISPQYFARPRRDTNIVYGFTIGSLFIFGAICGLVANFLSPGAGLQWVTPHTDLSNLGVLLPALIFTLGMTSFIFAGLHLLPVPGFCGWYLLLNNVSPQLAYKIQEKQLYISLIFLGLIIFKLFSAYFMIFLSLFVSISGGGYFFERSTGSFF